MFNQLRRLALFTFSGLAIAAVSGCASDRPSAVPSSALLKTAGNERLVYVAEDSGTLYVTDQGRNGVVYAGPVIRGDRVVVDPKTDELRINSQVVSSKDITSNQHKIFLLPGAVAPVTVSHTTVETIARPDSVPASAMLKGEGKERLEYTAENDGTIWVTDADRKDVVYTAAVLRGDQVVIDPKVNQVTVNGRNVYDRGNLPNDDRRIFFQPGPLAVVVPGRTTTVDRTTTVVAPVPAAGRVTSERVTTITPSGTEVRTTTVLPPSGVPASAILRSDSAGRTNFAADRPGTVWVVDAATGRIVYTSRLVTGDVLIVDPDTNRLTLNGQPMVESGRIPAGRYHIFYDNGQ